MDIKLTKSPVPLKKFRVTFSDGSTTDFGLEPYSDYTRHKDALRMRTYVTRHGGNVPVSIKKLTDPNLVNERMLEVGTSNKEYWTKKGIKTPGFWSRWLLWSAPTIKKAIQVIENKFDVNIKYARR